MEKLKTKIEDLEKSIKDLRKFVKGLNFYSCPSNLIIVGGAFIFALSVLLLPKWISIGLIALVSVYLISDRRKMDTYFTRKFDDFLSIIHEINDCNITISEINKEKEDYISSLTSTIEKLQSSLSNDPKDVVTATEVELEKNRTDIYFEELLKKIQRLDFEVEDFGAECASYLRKEFLKSLRICGLEFVDYSNESKNWFTTEKAAIDSVDCTARAIVTISQPRKVVLMGRAFIPESI